MDNIEALTCNRCGASAPPNIEQGKPYKCENCGNTCVWPKQESIKVLFQGDNRLCPNCGLDNPTERAVCRNCGERLTKRCPICNDEYYVGDNYCNNGHKYEKTNIIPKTAAPPQVDFGVAAKAVHDTARSFLVGGILNIIVGCISTAVGWFFGIFTVVVGIIELVNAYQYWQIPPRKNTDPTYLPVLEMISAVGGSLWLIFIGYANRKRLTSPEVKNYFLALQSGQPVMTGSTATIAAAVSAGVPVLSVKKCPSCGNSIPIEAKICQFCRQSFSDEEIGTAKKQFEADLTQRQAAALETRRVKQGKSLRVSGAIIAVIGVLVLALFLAVQFSSASTDNSGGFVGAIFLCPTPLILLGGGLFAWGYVSLRKIKEEKEKLKPVQTMSV